MNTGNLLLASSLLALAAGSAQAAIVTIDFESFGVSFPNSQTFNGGQESGFAMATSGGQQTLGNFGALSPSPLANTYLVMPEAAGGTMTVTEQSATTPFEFLGFDMALSGGVAATLTVTGFFNAIQVATDTFTNSPGSAASYGPGNLAGLAIDELRFGYSNAAGATIFLDHIRLETDATVPVPASALLMLTGLLGLAGLRRRQAG